MPIVKSESSDTSRVEDDCIDDENNATVVEDHIDDVEYRRISVLPRGMLALPRGTLALPCLLYTSPSPRDATLSRMPSSA